MFKTKHEVRDYLNRYALRHGVHERISFGETVLSLDHMPVLEARGIARPWRILTDRRELRAQRVVVATGLNREPHVPSFEGACEFAERHDLRHSWHVPSCAGYRGKRVLLVGSGNSAAELAVALHEAEAGAIDILV